MKALTLHQPWATLIVLGAKRIETRSWGTNYRGPLAIHAGKITKPVVDDLRAMLNAYPDWLPDLLLDFEPMPSGAVIATANLVDVVEMDRSFVRQIMNGTDDRGARHEADLGNYAPGRFAWILENVEPVVPTAPARGYQGLWDWPSESVESDV